jgi:hypothetical protein
MQTDQGLFVAALESSHDWRTSYDYLGPVKCGYQMDFKFSSERESMDEPQPDDGPRSGMVLIAHPEDDGAELPPPKELPKTKKKPGKGKKTETKAEKERKQRLAARKAGKTAGTYPPPERTIRAYIDYPYEANEFASPSKRIKLCNEKPDKDAKGDDAREAKDPPESTSWAEETDGRRERNANM